MTEFKTSEGDNRNLGIYRPVYGNALSAACEILYTSLEGYPGVEVRMPSPNDETIGNPTRIQLAKSIFTRGVVSIPPDFLTMPETQSAIKSAVDSLNTEWDVCVRSRELYSNKTEHCLNLRFHSTFNDYLGKEYRSLLDVIAARLGVRRESIVKKRRYGDVALLKVPLGAAPMDKIIEAMNKMDRQLPMDTVIRVGGAVFPPITDSFHQSEQPTYQESFLASLG
jgi:hypothetical protein